MDSLGHFRYPYHTQMNRHCHANVDTQNSGEQIFLLKNSLRIFGSSAFYVKEVKLIERNYAKTTSILRKRKRKSKGNKYVFGK